MIRIRSDQMETFNEGALEDFKTRLSARIVETLASSNRQMSEDELKRQIDAGLEMCGECDLSVEREVVRLFDLIFSNFTGFTPPPPRKILHILYLHGISADEKLQRLQRELRAPIRRDRIQTSDSDFGTHKVGQSVQPCPFADHPPEAAWVEIRLVGEDNRPIPYEQYELTAPNGNKLKGYLDAKGYIRVGAIGEAGTCTVLFPDLDSDAWERKTEESSSDLT